MATTNPIQFIQQVRSEVGKITWPGRREVATTTFMVFLLAVIMATFFFFVDWGIRTILELVLTSF